MTDIRLALRLLRKEKGFAAVVIFVLALGIGANTTVFTLVNAVLFRGLPFENSERILFVTGSQPGRGRDQVGVSYPDFKDWRDQTKSLEGLAALSGFQANLSDRHGTPERYNGSYVSANLFPLLGPKPVLGRDFRPADEKPGAPAVALLAYGVWRDRYGLDPGVVGRSVRINEVPATIIGVMAEGMKFPFNNDLWMPLIEALGPEDRGRHGLMSIGKLPAGGTIEETRTEMNVIAKRLEKEYAKTNQGVGVVVKPFNDQANGGEIRVVF
ncbi:MAG: ABC transporter permease, partial [Bryobacteraceae bacterium]